MNKLLLGASVGMMAGVAMMMSPMGKTLKKDMQMGMHKARKLAREMEQM